MAMRLVVVPGQAESKDVVIDIWPLGKTQAGMRLKWCAATPISRLGIERLIETSLEDSVHRIAKEAYEAGYHDGRGHEKKKTYFTRWLDAVRVVW